MIQSRTLRFRMIFLFCALVGVLFAGSYICFGVLLAREVSSQLDRQLLATASPVVADMMRDPDEKDVSKLDEPQEYFEVLDTSGRVRQMSKNLQGRPLDLGGASLNISRPDFRIVPAQDGKALRLALAPFRRGNEPLLLAVAVPNREAKEVLEIFVGIIGVLLPVNVLLTAALSSWYVSKSLAPITALTQHARQMAERVSCSDRRALWTPLVVGNPDDELGKLAQTFNDLFVRVDSALRQLRQFVTDASHELRTPLAVLQGETELVLSEPRPPEDYEKTLFIIDGELKKLARIVEGLFTLSMADAGQLRLAKEPLYLNEVLEEACALAASRSHSKNIIIQRDFREEVAYEGDEAFLRQLFLIFLDNAIKYSPPDTSVDVRLQIEDSFVGVRFEDHGIGISGEHLPRIFERFYRAASSTNEEAQSGGLGLAIAQAFVRAHGGTIDCESVVGQGTAFTVKFPHLPRETSLRAASTQEMLISSTSD